MHFLHSFFASSLEGQLKGNVKIEKNVETDEAVKNFGDYISNQVLASSISIEDKVEDATDFDFEDFIVKVKIAKK